MPNLATTIQQLEMQAGGPGSGRHATAQDSLKLYNKHANLSDKLNEQASNITHVHMGDKNREAALSNKADMHEEAAEHFSKAHRALTEGPIPDQVGADKHFAKGIALDSKLKNYKAQISL